MTGDVARDILDGMLHDICKVCPVHIGCATCDYMQAVHFAIEEIDSRSEVIPDKYEELCGIYMGICPICKENVSTLDAYCSHCGHRLKWD